MTSRRGFLLGLGAALAAPAVVRAESLMPLWVPKPRLIIPEVIPGFLPADGRLLSALKYPELFKAIGYAFGGDGFFFRLPHASPDEGAPTSVQGQTANVSYVIATGAGLSDNAYLTAGMILAQVSYEDHHDQSS